MVVDDQSSDDSIAVIGVELERLQERWRNPVSVFNIGSGLKYAGLTTRLVRNTKNLGPAGTRNAGVNASSGDLLFFCDAGDLVCCLSDFACSWLCIGAVRFRPSMPGYLLCDSGKMNTLPSARSCSWAINILRWRCRRS